MVTGPTNIIAVLSVLVQEVKTNFLYVLVRPTLLDQKKSDRFFFSDNDHKLYLMGQKNTFSDHFFSEEGLSEEQLIRKYLEKTRKKLSEKKWSEK